MRRRITFIILLTHGFNIAWSQQSIYHGENRLVLEKSLSSYQKGDTLKSFDSLRNMSLNGVFLTSKFTKNLDLHYSDSTGVRTIDVPAVLKDTVLYWNGGCVELDRSSKHSTVRFFTMNKFEGVQTYYVRGQVQSVESKNKGNVTDIGLDYSTGKLSYYWVKDSLNIEHGSSISFHENGEIKTFGHYINGVRVGKWLYYDEKAKLVLIENYKNGALRRSKKQK